MKKLYKNLTSNRIYLDLFGVGVVDIPAAGAAVELESTIAEVIMGMTSERVLEEVDPADLSGALAGDIDAFENMSIEELRQFCDLAEPPIEYKTAMNRKQMLSLVRANA